MRRYTQESPPKIYWDSLKNAFPSDTVFFGANNLELHSTKPKYQRYNASLAPTERFIAIGYTVPSVQLITITLQINEQSVVQRRGILDEKATEFSKAIKFDTKFDFSDSRVIQIFERLTGLKAGWEVCKLTDQGTQQPHYVLRTSSDSLKGMTRGAFTHNSLWPCVDAYGNQLVLRKSSDKVREPRLNCVISYQCITDTKNRNKAYFSVMNRADADLAKLISNLTPANSPTPFYHALSQAPTLKHTQILMVARKITAAVKDWHSGNAHRDNLPCVHLDIKPPNILVKKGPNVDLTKPERADFFLGDPDFASANQLDQPIKNHMKGTPSFLPDGRIILQITKQQQDVGALQLSLYRPPKLHVCMIYNPQFQNPFTRQSDGQYESHNKLLTRSITYCVMDDEFIKAHPSLLPFLCVASNSTSYGSRSLEEIYVALLLEEYGLLTNLDSFKNHPNKSDLDPVKFPSGELFQDIVLPMQLVAMLYEYAIQKNHKCDELAQAADIIRFMLRHADTALQSNMQRNLLDAYIYDTLEDKLYGTNNISRLQAVVTALNTMPGEPSIAEQTIMQHTLDTKKTLDQIIKLSQRDGGNIEELLQIAATVASILKSPLASLICLKANNELQIEDDEICETLSENPRLNWADSVNIPIEQTAALKHIAALICRTVLQCLQVHPSGYDLGIFKPLPEENASWLTLLRGADPANFHDDEPTDQMKKHLNRFNLLTAEDKLDPDFKKVMCLLYLDTLPKETPFSTAHI